MKSSSASILRIVVAYLGVAGCWTFISDRLLVMIVRSPEQLTAWATVKGEFFVAVNAVLLLLLLRSSISRLQDSEQRRKQVFDAVPDAYYLVDLEGTFLEGNGAAEQLSGFANHELVGRSLFESDFLTRQDQSQAAGQLAQRAPDKATDPTRYTLKRKDGKLISVQVQKFHARSEASLVAVGILRDDTRSQQDQESMRRTEARFSALFKGSPIAIGISDISEGRYIEVNDTFLQTIGYERHEVIGHTSLELGIWPSNEARAAMIEELRSQGRVQQLDLQFRRRDGRVIDLQLFAELVDLGGERYLVAMVLDVTKRKKAEEALARHEAELAAIYDSAPMMICVVDSQRQIERMNRTMTEFLGTTTDPALPQRPGDLFGCVNSLEQAGGCGHGTGCERCPLPLAIFTTFQTGKPCRQIETHLLLTRNGNRRDIRIRASTVLIKLHHKPKVLLIFEDVTSQRELEAQLMQAQKMEAVGQLAGGVAHDFNNILAAMLLHLQVMQLSGGLSPDTLSSLRELELGVHRAASLTRQLLLFGRVRQWNSKQLT